MRLDCPLDPALATGIDRPVVVSGLILVQRAYADLVVDRGRRDARAARDAAG